MFMWPQTFLQWSDKVFCPYFVDKRLDSFLSVPGIFLSYQEAQYGTKLCDQEVINVIIKITFHYSFR